MWIEVKRCPRIEVNEAGQIRYKDTGKIASTSIASTGYVQVGVWYEGKSHTFNVHRLVAEAFIPNPDNLPEVNHKDEDRSNCHVDNLEWCTRKYNNNYGTHIEKQRQYGCKPVIATNKKSGVSIFFRSLEEAGRHFGCEANNIRRCLKGKRKTAQGYYWKYAEEVA